MNFQLKSGVALGHRADDHSVLLAPAGYSNLSYLNRFPIDPLKLEDKSVAVPDTKQ